MASTHRFTHPDSSDESSNSDADNDFLHPSTNPGAESEFADYNPRKRRRTTRDPKESAALGVFGSESEDEGGGKGKRWKRGNLRGKGMSFVSSGEKVRREDDDEDEDDEEEEEDGKFEAPRFGLGAQQQQAEEQDEEDEDEQSKAEVEETAGLRGLGAGLGLGMGARGIGFQSPAAAPSSGRKAMQFTRSTPLGKGFVPSSAAIPILNDDAEEVLTPRIARPSAFSTPTTNGKGKGKASGGTAINAGSFAARMMAKMGYKEGQGLGKEGTGRSGIIEVQLRPQGVGLGAVKEKSKQEIEEEKRQAKIKGVKYEGGSSDEERKKRKAKRSNVGSTNGSGVSTPRRVQKPKYRTVEELQRAAPGLQIPDAFAPILDMTGPGQKLLTSTSGLLTPTNGVEFETAEQGESRKLARRAQNDLTSFVEEWKNLEERKAYVEMLIIQQEQELEEEQREFDRMKGFFDAVNSISDSVADGQWDPVFAALKSASSSLDASNPGHPESAKQFAELTDIAVAAVHPFLRQSLEGWLQLEDPKLNGLALQLLEIRHILGADAPSAASTHSRDYLINDGTHRIHSKSTTPYESMIYKLVFPKLISTINHSWTPSNPTPLLTLFQTWEPLLPAFVKSQLLEQAVVQKLNAAVSTWNPRRSHSSKDLPHLWLFPWLQYLPAHHADPSASTGLVSDVKRKFRKLIDSWDFRKGVIPGFTSWREVLSPSPKVDHWKPLIMNHVLPSMGSFLSNPKYFVVDPQDQAPYMSALTGVIAWESILTTKVIGQVIVETVFPAWHNVLHQWLTVVGPNQEIGEWFQWWRDDALPETLRELPSIQGEFDKGEAMIEHALDLGARVSTDLPAPVTTKPSSNTTKSHHTSHHSHKDKKPHLLPLPTQQPPPLPKTAPVEEPTVKDALASWSIDNDLQFLPEKKIMHAAGPLYRVTAAGNGKNGVLIYIRGERVVAVQRKPGGNGNGGPGEEAGERAWKEIEIQWGGGEEGRDVLLGMAWAGVK